MWFGIARRRVVGDRQRERNFMRFLHPRVSREMAFRSRRR